MADVKKEVEAILFSSGRTVTLKEFQKLLHMRQPGLVLEAIKELKAEYEGRGSPIMVVEEGEGWKFAVKEAHLRTVQQINPHTELSRSVLETLAVITWKQPIVQSDVIKIRTNKAYDHIAELERLGFITKTRHGRSYALKVTQKFLDYFDLPDMSAIKEVFKEFKDVEVAVQKKADQLEKGNETVTGPEEGRAAPETEGAEETEGSQYKTYPTEGESEKDESDLEPYIDVLPPIKMPKSGRDLEVYAVSEDEIERDEKTEESEEKEEGEAEEEAAEEEGEESAADKARRLAKQLLEEEAEAEPGKIEAAERELHPELEKFISKSMEELKPKETEDHREDLEAQESEEGEEAEEGGAEEGSGQEEGEEGRHEAGEEEGSDEDEKPMPAEEYPGQFAKESREEQRKKSKRKTS